VSRCIERCDAGREKRYSALSLDLTLHSPTPTRTISLRRAVIGHGRSGVAGPFDFDLQPDEFLVIAGPNGAGKSTFVKTLLGVLPPLQGELENRGVRFGYVPQREHLDPIWPFSTLEIALMGTVPRAAPFRFTKAADKRRGREILEQVGLADDADQAFRSLSGGQQQRALIARALMAEPDVLVLDEPTNHLDVPGERAVYELLGDIHREQRKSIVVICHHLAPVLRLATRLAVLRDRKLSVGTVEEVLAAGHLRGLVDDDLRWSGAATEEEAT